MARRIAMATVRAHEESGNRRGYDRRYVGAMSREADAVLRDAWHSPTMIERTLPPTDS